MLSLFSAVVARPELQPATSTGGTTATVLVALLAAAVAFLGVCIAWGQWHTARQKLILDLRDKRYTSYRSVMDLLDEVNRHPNPGYREFRKVETAIDESRLLFGSEVIASFRALKAAMYDMAVAERSERSYREQDRHDDAGELHRMSTEAFELYEGTLRTLNSVIDPYLRMDQKLPRPPYEWPSLINAWLKHRWANRPDGSS